MVILEGCDGAGKTTLLKRLVDEHGFEIGERATKDRKKLYTVTRQDTHTALSQAVLGHGPPKIWDRLYYSEKVYAPIVGRVPEFNRAEQTHIELLLTVLRVPIIVCMPPEDVVRRNAYADDEQMDGVNENIGRIYREYKRPSMGFTQYTMYYDYTGTTSWGGGKPLHKFYTYEEISGVINKYMTERKVREW